MAGRKYMALAMYDSLVAYDMSERKRRLDNLALKFHIDDREMKYKNERNK